MPGWFGGLFKRKPGVDSSVPKEEGDRILEYLFDLVQEKSLVVELIEKYKGSNRLPAEKRDHLLITIYSSLELFLTKNRPPLTRRFFTRESLRLEIRQNFHLTLLSFDFRLIFLHEREQAVVLCSIASRELIRFIASNVGTASIQAIYDKAVHGTVLEGALVDPIEGLRIDTLNGEFRRVSVDKTISAFTLLNTTLYQEILNLLGEQSALALVERVYNMVKVRYESDLVSRFLESLPLGVLESERATFLSREDLEEKIQARTRELVQVQKDLQAERDRANTIIVSIGEGLLTLDSQQNIIQANPAAEHLLEVTSSQIIGKPWEEHFVVMRENDSKPLNSELLEKAAATKEAQSFGLEANLILHTASKQIPISANIALLNEATGGSVIAFRDISQEKQANTLIEHTVEERTEQVEEGQARLVASINSLELGFLMTNSELEVLIANQAAEKILAIEHRANKGLTFEEVAKLLSDSINLSKETEKCLAEGKSLDFDNLAFGKQFLRIYISPIVHEDKAIGCAILIEDVTEAKVLARSKEEFFTIASHELRTPLIAIRGFASMIKELYPQKLTPDKVLMMVDRIDTSGSRLLAIVNTFLDVSRLEQGKMPIKPEAFILEELITACSNELSNLAKEKGLILSFEQHTTSSVSSDKNLVKQVIYNLIGNGVKFTEKGSVFVDVTQEEGRVVIKVTDTGNGIPDKAQALLFRKFQQTGDSLLTRDNSQGTGLGLYISRLIADQLGGSLLLEKSVEGKGSTFVFSLPMKTN